MYGGQGTICETQFCLSTLWVQGLKLRSLGVAAKMPAPPQLSRQLSLCIVINSAFEKESLKSKELNQFYKIVCRLCCPWCAHRGFARGPVGGRGCGGRGCRSSALLHSVHCRMQDCLPPPNPKGGISDSFLAYSHCSRYLNQKCLV